MSIKKSFRARSREFEISGLDEDDNYLKGITGEYESNFQKFCMAFLRPDDIAIDIGANIGVTSIILSQYVPEGTVYAIEPGKKIFELLEENIKINKLDNVKAINCAISNITGKSKFIENSAYGYIDLNSQDNSSEKDLVCTNSLDSIINEFKIKKVNFIKIDVEGFEPLVLKGSEKIIAKLNPLIYLEMNSWCLIDHSNTNPLEFANYIFDKFKYVYRINKNQGSSMLFERINSAKTLVYDNIVFHGSVDDIVLTNDSSIIDYKNVEKLQQGNSFDIYAQYSKAIAEHESLRNNLNYVSNERDVILNQLNSILKSKSWRYTKWLRTICQTLVKISHNI